MSPQQLLLALITLSALMLAALSWNTATLDPASPLSIEIVQADLRPSIRHVIWARFTNHTGHSLTLPQPCVSCCGCDKCTDPYVYLDLNAIAQRIDDPAPPRAMLAHMGSSSWEGGLRNLPTFPFTIPRNSSRLVALVACVQFTEYRVYTVRLRFRVYTPPGTPPTPGLFQGDVSSPVLDLR